MRRIFAVMNTKINRIKKIIVVFLLAVMVMPAAFTLSADITTRTMVIFETEGDDIKMTKGTVKRIQRESRRETVRGVCAENR